MNCAPFVLLVEAATMESLSYDMGFGWPLT